MEDREKKIVLAKHDFIAAIAYCGILQSPYFFPRNLCEALDQLCVRIDEMGIFESSKKKSSKSYRVFDSWKQVTEIVHELIFTTPSISIWNVSQNEIDNGVTSTEDPARTMKFSFSSRYGGPEADFDFIDLDALVRNVVNMIGLR